MVPRARVELGEIGWFIREIIEDGGEGIILQRSGSLYTEGRSSALLKLKAGLLFLFLFISFLNAV